MSCVHCEDWGCRRCKPEHEVAASTGGEQGPDADELELGAVKAERDRYRIALETIADRDCHWGCGSVAIEALRAES